MARDSGGNTGGQPRWATFLSHDTRIELATDILYHNQPWNTIAKVISPFQYVTCANVAVAFKPRGRGRCFKHDRVSTSSQAKKMCSYCLLELLHRYKHLRSLSLIVEGDASGTTKQNRPPFDCYGRKFAEPETTDGNKLRREAQAFLDDLETRYVSSHTPF